MKRPSLVLVLMSGLGSVALVSRMGGNYRCGNYKLGPVGEREGWGTLHVSEYGRCELLKGVVESFSILAELRTVQQTKSIHLGLTVTLTSRARARCLSFLQWLQVKLLSVAERDEFCEI